MDYWERQYNPRLAVPHVEQYFDSWRQRAVEVRASLNGTLDLPYGPHPRERLDVFRAREARATLIFLHGGYWRAFSKDDFSWVAEPFVRAGMTVVIPTYPLCPEASLSRISESVSSAMRFIAREVLDGEEGERVLLAGHSAGAHLAAMYVSGSADRDEPRLDPAAFLCISGLFDLVPLLQVKLLEGMGWNERELLRESPLYRRAPRSGRMILAVGDLESREFHRQSERLADAWADRCTGVVSIPGADHFGILDTLRAPDSLLSRQLLRHASGR